MNLAINFTSFSYFGFYYFSKTAEACVETR